MTLDEIITEVRERANDHAEAMAHAEADGNSDYDYYEGLVEAYSCVLGMLESVEN